MGSLASVIKVNDEQRLQRWEELGRLYNDITDIPISSWDKDQILPFIPLNLFNEAGT
tara:strand:+ start:264 stop:434 length:171 start_codon:yes stop_codon:yes gene_type:complete